MSVSRSSTALLLAAASAATFVLVASAQVGRPTEPAVQDPAPQEPAAPDPAAGRGGRQGGAPAQGPRPYAQVITAAAKTDDGVFKVHRVNDTLYFEIPKADLD